MTVPEEPPATPPGEDLRPDPLPYEHQAEYIARVRSEGIVSTSPSDIVPNVPWSNMGPPPEVEEEPEGDGVEVVVEDPLTAALAGPEPEVEEEEETYERRT